MCTVFMLEAHPKGSTHYMYGLLWVNLDTSITRVNHQGKYWLAMKLNTRQAILWSDMLRSSKNFIWNCCGSCCLDTGIHSSRNIADISLKYRKYRTIYAKQDHCRGMYLPPSTAGEEILNWKFSPLHRTLLYHPVGQKFTGNSSICYGFRDIDTFSFSTKIQDGRRKWRKLKFFPFAQDTLIPPCGSKIRSKSLYLLRFSRYWQFFIFCKNPRWPLKVTKIEISPLCKGDCCTTLWVKNSLEIALSLTVFKILTLFHFPQKSKMAAESGENWNFPPLHRRLMYHPVGQKFARNRSISYGFRDIDTFWFSAKIQDGRRKWQKLKLEDRSQKKR